MSNQEIIKTSKYEYISEVKEYMDILRCNKSSNTINTYFTSIDNFLDYSNVESFDDIVAITKSQCQAYQNKLKAFGLKPKSINTYTRNVKVFLNWLKDNEKIEENPFKIKGIKESNKKRSFLNQDEVTAMYKACKNVEERAIFALLVTLGLRRSELVNLKVSDISGYRVDVIGKGDKYRPLFMQDDVLELIQQHLNTRNRKDFEYVFYSRMGKPYSPESIRLKIKSLAKRAGLDEKRIDELTPHSLRRTAATNLIERNVNLRTVQGFLGHASINTTLLYANITSKGVENAMRSNPTQLQ